MVLKDTAILLSHIFYGGFSGFKDALTLHFVTLPLDILALLVLGIWGTIVMNSEDAQGCRDDPDCKAYYGATFVNIALSYSYIVVCLVVKPGALMCFSRCSGGLSWINMDEQEGFDWQQRRLHGRGISGLHAASFRDLWSKELETRKSLGQSITDSQGD